MMSASDRPVHTPGTMVTLGRPTERGGVCTQESGQMCGLHAACSACHSPPQRTAPSTQAAQVQSMHVMMNLIRCNPPVRTAHLCRGLLRLRLRLLHNTTPSSAHACGGGAASTYLYVFPGARRDLHPLSVGLHGLHRLVTWVACVAWVACALTSTNLKRLSNLAICSALLPAVLYWPCMQGYKWARDRAYLRRRVSHLANVVVPEPQPQLPGRACHVALTEWRT